MTNDGDLDLVAYSCSSAVWYENQGNYTFNKHIIGPLTPLGSGAARTCTWPSDLDKDNDADVVVCSPSQGAGWFENLGTSWQYHCIDSSGDWHYNYHVIRYADVDLDNDIDVVAVNCRIGRGAGDPYLFRNDGSMNFTKELIYNVGTDTTGWRCELSDFNSDGYPDFYLDGSIAGDIDLDGLPDIAGVYKKVGYLRQYPFGTFSLYDIDNVSNSHWVNITLLKKCLPSVDLLVTDEGAHIVYENKMLEGFASIGYLESSILELTPPNLEPCTLKFLGYKACVPYDTSLSFYWRVGLDSTDIDSSSWNGPMNASIGMNVADSFFIGLATGRMFQYKAEFKGAPDDIAVLYEVWITYECSPLSVEEIGTRQGTSLQFIDGKLILHLSYEDFAKLEIYDIAGRRVRRVFDGCLSPGVYEFDTPEKSGIYFARVHYMGGIKTLKFTKLK